MWILIITIFSYGHAPAVTPIYGFDSEKSCQNAGMVYKAKMPDEVNFTCVSK